MEPSIKEKLCYLMQTEGISQIKRGNLKISLSKLDMILDARLFPVLADIEELYKQSYGKAPDYTQTNSFKNPNFHIFLS